MSKRKLSFKRLFMTLIVIAALGYGGFIGWQKFQAAMALENLTPWAAPYVDVTATPAFQFEQIGEHNPGSRNIVLSFIVSDKDEPCTPTWGTAYKLDAASSALDLDRRITRFRQKDGTIAISFGGLLNDELAVKCKDNKKLKDAYTQVIERYGIDTVDFDIEGEALKDSESLKRRATVLSEIQKEFREKNRKLAIWFTLPAATFGLTEEGTNAVSTALESGIDLAGVNIMTMNYGQSKERNESVGDASKRALYETHRQLGILYKQAGINLVSESVWTKIGATPMIGQNDIPGEIFTLEDAIKLNEFAKSMNIARVSMWSLNRDVECGGNYVNLTIVSDSCSGIKQESFEFSNILGDGFKGTITGNAALITVSDQNKALEPDDPAKSPYQIWKEDGVYLEGTKVVWRHNVYQAKWWTKGDLPDNPVLQSWQTPWQMVGPVMPGEKPVLQPTLPVGSYPEWSGTTIYDAGEIVLFKGVPYRAKWWTEGDSPAISTSSPDSSPWIALKQKEIEEITKELQSGSQNNLQ